MRKLSIIAATLSIALTSMAKDNFELLPFGDFNQWVTRNIPESKLIGGKTKVLYEIAPTRTINGAIPYTNMGGSPWATSNVYAKVVGVVKGSNAVFPDTRSGDNKCAKLTTIMEHCKAVGVINVDVVVAGSLFLGKLFEPVKSTSDPYSKMEMDIPFTKRPKALRYDYKLYIPSTNERTYSSGFGKKRTLPGHDNAEVFVILQRRWEDAEGNLYAKRVGTGRELLAESTPQWVNAHELPIIYGDITSNPAYKPFMGLISEDKSYYARNSHGKMVPVKEVGWDSADATPTHILVMASAGSGTAYIGTIGLTLWVDNIGLVY